MRIGVDIDDVLADFAPSFIKYINKTYNQNLSVEKLYSFYFPVLLGGTAEESMQKIFDFYNHESFKNIKPLNHSQEAVKKLAKANKLILITARPDFLKTKTMDWIQKHYENTFSDIHFSFNHYSKYGKLKKYEICKNEQIDILIEDSPEYAKEVAKLGKKAFLLNAPWNQTKTLPQNVYRVKTWRDIEDKLTEKDNTQNH